MRVAPLVGAWIEILYPSEMHSSSGVAPLVGAWIEIDRVSEIATSFVVAPLVGAWIEMANGYNKKLTEKGRSPRGSVD